MNKIFLFLKDKYILTIFCLTAWVIFFDKNDLRTQIELRKEVKQLEEERGYFAKEISEITSDIKELSMNPKTLERYGREKYLMKRDNEDIFVIVKNKASQ